MSRIRSATTSRPGRQRSTFDQDDEFVAPESTHRVPFSKCTGQSGGHTAQQLIARFVAQGVIDVLEVVEVEEERRRRCVFDVATAPASVPPGSGSTSGWGVR